MGKAKYFLGALLLEDLDVMNIEKNMFKNFFNTIIDVKGKKKDNIKAIMDITLFFHHKNMKLVYAELTVTKPKVSFTFNKNIPLLVYQ